MKTGINKFMKLPLRELIENHDRSPTSETAGSKNGSPSVGLASVGLQIMEIGAWSLDVGASKLDNGASKSEIGAWKLKVAFWRPRNLLGDRVPDRAPGHW